MGIGGISIWQLLIILLIVVLLFGTKKLRGIGGDLGGAFKNFKKAVNEETPADDKSSDTEEHITSEEQSSQKSVAEEKTSTSK